MLPLYCIPGLGTDPRIFRQLATHIPLAYLPWLSPAHLHEPLPEYCERLAQNLPEQGEINLLGLSFGAVAALEIARQRPVNKVIILSGIKSSREKPNWLRLFRHLPLYRLSKGKWRIRTLPLWAPRFGITDPDEIALLQKMFADSGDPYRMWAIRTLAHWEGSPPEGLQLHHLHGSEDRVFPVSRIQQATVLPGCNHFMVYQNAELVGERLKAWISS